MTRALIINAYSVRNAGDAAIMLATAKLVRQAGISDIAVATRYFREDEDFYARYDVKTVPPAIAFPRTSRGGDFGRAAQLLASTVAVLPLLFVYRLQPQLALSIAKLFGARGISNLMEADKVIVAGGGYMYSSRKKVSLALPHSLLTTKLATMLKKSVAMMPQSVGPLHKAVDKLAVKWGLADVSPLVVRDEWSLEECDNLFNEAKRVVLCPDVVFYGLPSPVGCQRRKDVDISSSNQGSRLRVGIVAMDWSWARASGRNGLDRYISEMTSAIQLLINKGYQVVLLGNSRMPDEGQDDFEIARQIAAPLNLSNSRSIHILNRDTDLEGLCDTISGLNVIIGTRLHSCILALIAGIPAICLAYQPKAFGTYQLMQLSHLCFDVESFTAAEVARAVDDVLSNSQKYRATIAQSIESARSAIANLYLEALRSA